VHTFLLLQVTLGTGDVTATPHPMLSRSLQTLTIEIPNPVDDPLSTVPLVRLTESVKSGVHEARVDEPPAGITE